MPRKSAAELAMTSPPPPSKGLRAPESLSEPERKLFVAIIRNCGADHFRESDLPLLCRYVEASVLAERAAEELRQKPIIDNKPSPWVVIKEKATRDMVALSMRLRLSPQARKGAHAMAQPKGVSWMDIMARYGPEVADAWMADKKALFNGDDDESNE